MTVAPTTEASQKETTERRDSWRQDEAAARTPNNDAVHLGEPMLHLAWNAFRRGSDRRRRDAADRRTFSRTADALFRTSRRRGSRMPRRGELSRGRDSSPSSICATPSEPRGHDEPGEIARAGLRYLALPVSHGSLGDRQFDALRDFLRDPPNRPVARALPVGESRRRADASLSRARRAHPAPGGAATRRG